MPQVLFRLCNYEILTLKKMEFTMTDIRTQVRVTTALQGARRLAHNVLGPRPPAQQLCALRHQRKVPNINSMGSAESGSSPESRTAEEPEALPQPDTEAAPLQEPRDDDVSCCTRYFCTLRSTSTTAFQRIVRVATHCEVVLCMMCSKAGAWIRSHLVNGPGYSSSVRDISLPCHVLCVLQVLPDSLTDAILQASESTCTAIEAGCDRIVVRTHPKRYWHPTPHA